jgi:hypothetical protein
MRCSVVRLATLVVWRDAVKAWRLHVAIADVVPLTIYVVGTSAVGISKRATMAIAAMSFATEIAAMKAQFVARARVPHLGLSVVTIYTIVILGSNAAMEAAVVCSAYLMNYPLKVFHRNTICR